MGEKGRGGLFLNVLFSKERTSGFPKNCLRFQGFGQTSIFS